MPSFFQRAESEQRATMQSLYRYAHNTMYWKEDGFSHNFESTFEQAYRFFAHFDPDGAEATEFRRRKSLDAVLDQIAICAWADLPCLEAFLDVALSLCDHFHGFAGKTFAAPLGPNPALEEILCDLDLLHDNGAPKEPLILELIAHGHYLPPPQNMGPFLDKKALEAWHSASPADKSFMKECANEKPLHLEYWLQSRWRFGHWMDPSDIARSHDLFHAHSMLHLQIAKRFCDGLCSGALE